ncbi:restriction endonuclease subunit S [Arthrobacter sp. H5]|uniref:restriction endonuclease subunit S n=1 Tax=Arthrobacter sp. H5 TaxID=1267973 RepID=UPI0004B28524|nr:restriction endonuclease subunit S [Arthrobacter sp. H5]
MRAQAGWADSKLDEVTLRGSGHTPNQQHPDYWDGDIGWISLADSGRLDQGYISSSTRRITTRGMEKSSAVLHPAGTVIMSRDAGVGKSAVLREAMAVSQHFIAWDCRAMGVLEPWYLYYWLQTHKGYFERMAVGSTIKTIGLPLFKRLTISHPPLPEQRKIAEILRTWDDAIERANTLVVRLRGQHRLLLQGLIARHAHGSHVALGDLVEPVKAKNAVGETNVLTSSAREGLVSQTEYFNKSVAGKNLAGYYLLHRGDFAYNRSSSAGHPFGAIRRLDRYDRGVISTLYLCFRLQENSPMSGTFLQNIFNSELLDRQLSPICHEGARSHGLLNIAQADFFELVVPVPSREAQEIANRALAASSSEIRLVKRKAELLRTQKQGLMQKLLTGQVRVNVAADINAGGQDNG